MGNIDLELIKSLYEQETNLARKQIYANHLRIAEDKHPICASCVIEDDTFVIPVSQSDEE